MTKRKRIDPKLITRKGLEAWFAEHVQPAQMEGHKSVLAAMEWFCAYQAASALLEDTTRHIAQAIQGRGLVPIRGWSMVESALDFYDDEDLERELRLFWELDNEETDDDEES